MARTTEQLRQLWGNTCATKAQLVTLYVADYSVPTAPTKSFPRGAAITVRKECRQAFEALLLIVAGYGYFLPADSTGAMNCRAITGGKRLSLHAFGIAGDLDWLDNPYGQKLVTTFPPEMVRDILALYTGNGVRVFRWGGDWDYNPADPENNYDAMHFECVASAAELATGIVVPFPTSVQEDESMKYGAQGPHVAQFQENVNLFLIATGTKVDDPMLIGCDGKFGDKTVVAMENVIGRLRDHRFHQLGQHPIRLYGADARDVNVDVRILMGAVIAEREVGAAA